jgi:hypothetical protein
LALQVNETHSTIFEHAPGVVHYHWHSTTFVAKLYNRTERQIRKWCINGLLAKRGIPVFKDSTGRWWISLNEKEAKNLI